MKTPNLHRRRPGFTLVELLVVIAIVMVLATLAFIFAKQGLAKATASKAMERMRQSGSILLANAQEKNGKFEFATDAEPANSEFLPYNIVRKELGIDFSDGENKENQLCDIMHWDHKKLKPTNFVRNCFGVNFTEIKGGAEGTEVIWKDDKVTTDAGDIQVRSLMQSTVGRPERYPILLESSDAKGNEIFSIREGEAGRVGMRDLGKSLGFFMDGSARPLDKKDLKNCGFSNAYDNTKTPPKSVKL